MKKDVMILAGADFLVDGGATASYFYGPLQPLPKPGLAWVYDLTKQAEHRQNGVSLSLAYRL